MSTKKKPEKKTKSRSEYRVEQKPLPGVDADEFRGFLDLSGGVPIRTVCPKCGYGW